ncbi:EamA family transporter [Actinomadura sp. CNU-125]|uniref:EamA family transporter n=1 Tax=Actinomadura sp. CNU-125 TaxID=1904961 RepID=UPI0021CCE731|nr:EamA family transporter [Actinomadura sp. CNU-125]
MRKIDPRLLAIAGAAFISVSAILFRLSGVSSGTGAFFRCALAMPVLLALALRERRRRGRAAGGGLDVLAGVLLGVDLVLWGASIGLVGAGIATVLVNVQVVVVPLLAAAVFRERPSRTSRRPPVRCSRAWRSRAVSPTTGRRPPTRCAARCSASAPGSPTGDTCS